MEIIVSTYSDQHSENNIDMIRSCLEDIFSKLNFRFVENGTILIKPNLCGRDPKLRSENTSAAFLEALVQIAVKSNSKIIIGHTSLLGSIEIDYPFEKLAKAAGFYEIEKKYPSVKLMNFDNEPQKKIKIDKITFSIPEIVDHVDQYINLTKLKTHAQTGASLSLKNVMGTVSMVDRKRMHSENVHHYIAELAKHVKPSINIIDGILAMEGQGPHHGIDVRKNLIIAGYDPVEVDSMAAYLMGMDLSEIPYIALAAERGVGKLISNELKENYKHLVSPFKKALPKVEKIKNLVIWATTSCTGCSSALVELGLVLDQLKAKGQTDFEMPRLDFVLGTGEGVNISEVGQLYAIGDCCKDFAKAHNAEFLPGCPLSIKKTRKFIFDRVEKAVLDMVKLKFKQLALIMEGAVMSDKIITDGYNKVSSKYDELWGQKTHLFNDNLIEALNFQQGDRVVDLACGTGVNCIKIAQKIGPSGALIGIDLSKGMLEEAKKRAEECKLTNCEFIHEDMLKGIKSERIPSNHFDKIVTFWALGYSDAPKVLKEMNRALKKDGKMGIIVNLGESPKNAYQVFMELASEFPDALKYAVNHNFPKDMDEFMGFFKKAGLNLDNLQTKYDSFTVLLPNGREVLNWMLQTGAGSLYDDAIDEQWKQKIHDLFAQRIERYKVDNQIAVTHEFIVAIYHKKE